MKSIPITAWVSDMGMVVCPRKAADDSNLCFVDHSSRDPLIVDNIPIGTRMGQMRILVLYLKSNPTMDIYPLSCVTREVFLSQLLWLVKEENRLVIVIRRRCPFMTVIPFFDTVLIVNDTPIRGSQVPSSIESHFRPSESVLWHRKPQKRVIGNRCTEKQMHWASDCDNKPYR